MSRFVKMFVVLAVSALAFSAAASADCFSWSNGFEFTGPTPQDAVYGCQVTPGTNAIECQETVNCNFVPTPALPYPPGFYPAPGYYPVGPGYFPGRPWGPGFGPGFGPRPGFGPGFGPRPGFGPGFGPRPGFGPGPGFGPRPGFGPGPHRDEADNA
jgi:hypothetical protein